MLYTWTRIREIAYFTESRFTSVFEFLYENFMQSRHSAWMSSSYDRGQAILRFIVDRII